MLPTDLNGPSKLTKFAGPLALLAVLAAGLINLRKPFAGDQALFVIGARAISHGETLYRDFWDLKQPGIYGFYWLGIRLPGSTEVAVHLLELLWFFAFAAVILICLRGWYRQKVYAALAAAVVCGIYFLICGPWHLTQVEGLVGFPLFVCAWLLLRPSTVKISILGMFVAGIAAACVALFKLILVILPICFFVMLMIRERRKHRPLLSCLLATALFGIGMAAVLLPIFIYYDSHDQLTLLYDTFITVPMRIASELPHNPLSILLSGLIWFFKTMGLLLPLAGMGAYTRRKDLFGLGLVVWVIVGFGLILIQRMGWAYHFLLMLFPIGILAVAGAETLHQTAAPINQSKGWTRLLRCLPILLLMPYLVYGLVKAGFASRDRRPLFYEEMQKNVALLPLSKSANDAKPGAIYVLGNPLIYYLANRPQAVAINGWSPEWLLADQWQQLANQLRLARPASIFVAQENDALVNDRGQVFSRVLKDHYQPVSSGDDGTWYAATR